MPFLLANYVFSKDRSFSIYNRFHNPCTTLHIENWPTVVDGWPVNTVTNVSRSRRHVRSQFYLHPCHWQANEASQTQPRIPAHRSPCRLLVQKDSRQDSLKGFAARLPAWALFGTVLSASPVLPNESYSRLELYRIKYSHQLEFLDYYFALLLRYQLVLVIMIIPALTAGSLGQEKERGTLFALFGTELTSRQILQGKLLGRLIAIVPLVLSTLPALVFIATYTGRGMIPLILVLGQETIIAFTADTACLLFGIWIPYTIAYAIPVFILASVGGPSTLLVAGMWIILPCVIVFCAALMGIDMLRVPPEMNETRQEGAFWFENDRAERQRINPGDGAG
jgi:ABC-type transport system involved in multi-copper enzyme maturation permease subunit